jgi:hypothetical protein
MALVETNPVLTNPWASQEKDEDRELMNIFLRLWDGKVIFRALAQIGSDTCSKHVLFVLQTLCWSVDPSVMTQNNVMAVQKLLEQRVLQQHPYENPKNFYFLANAKPLARDVDVSSMTMRDGMTIFVQYRNRGGCFVFSFTVLTMIFTAIMGSFCTCGLSLWVVPLLLPLLFILPLFCL